MKSICVFLISSFLFYACKTNSDTLFKKLDSNTTKINFKNTLTETETENILSYEYFYNGGGVAAGDFNNDGLTDLYFSGNQVENKLYLNKGKLKFEDISQVAGVIGRPNAWKTGVSVVDINADGWLDIYVCYSGLKSDSARKNQFFINNGINPKTHQISFTDRADEYGLADSGYSTQATFFDYDLDGDLDCFLINHNLAGYERKEANVMRNAYDYNAGDKLFRNDSKNNLTLKFTDVSKSAGIKSNPLGFGLGLSISDINQDGYPDIYVANDYVEDDYLYINQKNGTFKDELRDHLSHTSYSAMGVDIADINNDLRPDIMTLDMLPEDNERQKLLLWPDNWNTYQAQLANGFWYANMRNMLQLNNGNGKFTEIGQVAGVSNTDWSWGVLLADYDMDGYKDIFISNGLGKDLTNADFVKYFDDAQSQHLPLLEHLKQMPSSKTKNYIFRNNQNLQFENKQKDWGFDDFTIANGSIYADLDNDGDLDIITNNLNELARIYENTIQKDVQKNFISVKLKGENGNVNGLGAKIIVNKNQTQEVASTHGFLSSLSTNSVFAIPDKKCSVQVIWPNGKTETKNSEANKTIVFEEKNAVISTEVSKNPEPIFVLNTTSKLQYKQDIAEINNFNNQILLPSQYSYFGPKTAVADFNKDNIEDFIVGGTEIKKAEIFIGVKDNFVKMTNHFDPKNNQDIEIADLNNDGWEDIYLVNGDYSKSSYDAQNDEIWWNDGKGNFANKTVLEDKINGKTATIFDFDKDGDKDVFLGGYIQPLKYPYCDQSVLLINDGKGNFTIGQLGKLGLITSSLVLNNELIFAGEWLNPSKISLKTLEVTPLINNLGGWWNTMEKGDLDNDGDDDLVLGNMGLNTQLKATESEPATIIYDDFDHSFSVDFFMSYYIQGKPYPAYTRDEVVEQIPSLKKKFTTYKSYANANIHDFFDESVLKNAKTHEIKELKTLILENKKGEFLQHTLPIQAQFSPVYAVLMMDVNKDKKIDLILGGNNEKLRLRLGKVSGNYGQLFLNKGNLNFEYIPQLSSGLSVEGDVRSLKKVNNQIVFGVNNKDLRSYTLR